MRKMFSRIRSTRAPLVALFLFALVLEIFLRMGIADITVSFHVDSDIHPASETREVVFHDPDATFVSRQISGSIILHSAIPAFLMDMTLGVDDCLPEFTIPALSFSLTGPPYCDYHRPLILSGLASRLKPGVNYRYFARVSNFGGPGRFAISVIQSPLVYTLRVAACSTVIVTLVLLILGYKEREKALLVALALGILVRVGYFFSSELTARTMDFHGHVHYIRHVLEFWTIPHPNAGWEFHQPPLYYFLVAAMIKIYCSLTGTFMDVELIGQAFCSVFSAIALYYLLRMIQLVPADFGRAAYWRGLVMAVVATFPNLVFCTMRINNDVMLFALVNYVLYLILRQAVEGKEISFATKALTSVLAILTKGNGVVVVFFWILADFFLGGEKNRSARLRSTAGVVLIFALVAGAQTSFRYEQNFSLSPFYRDHVGLSPALEVVTEVKNFLTFNPFRVFYDTYTDPWGDGLHRYIFWEHLLRNFLFGEFNHGPYLLSLGRMMVLIWMFLVAVMLLQAVLAPLSRSFLIGILCLGTTFMLFISFRIVFPYSSHQDARFVPTMFSLLPFLIAERMIAFYRKYSKSGPIVAEGLLPVWEAAMSTLVVTQLAFLLWL